MGPVNEFRIDNQQFSCSAYYYCLSRYQLQNPERGVVGGGGDSKQKVKGF